MTGSNPEKMPIIQEATKRGLGEGQLEDIKVVGKPFEEVKEEFRLAAKRNNKKGRLSNLKKFLLVGIAAEGRVLTECMSEQHLWETLLAQILKSYN